MVMMTEHSDDRKPTWQGNRRRCRTNNRPDGTNKTGEKRSNATATTPLIKKETILVLHGNRQTGQLFLGRLDRLRKRLQKELPDVELLAVDAPHVCTDDDQEGDVSDGKTQQDDRLLLTWWHRQGNEYIGLKESLEKIQKETAHRNVVGLLGFSQGARLAHLLAVLHVSKPEIWFPQLQFVILAAGYDAPLPPQLHGDGVCDQVSISLQSLHIWGSSDPLIYPEQSRSVSEYYTNPRIMVHPGKHFVPSKAADVDQYVEFIEMALKQKGSDQSTAAVAPAILKTSPQPELRPVSATNGNIDNKKVVVEPEFPDEETQVLQQEEKQALEAIFPEEIELQSPKRIDLDTAEEVFSFPIIYHFRLLPSEEVDSSADDNSWPPQPLTLRVQYPRNYPSEAIPIFTLVHENTVFQFPSRQVESLMNVMRETATSELGMSSVLSVIYAAKDFLDAPPSEDFGVALNDQTSKLKKEISSDIDEVLNESKTTPSTGHPLVQPSTADEIVLGNLEGLEIAESLLRRYGDGKDGLTSNHSKGGGSFGTYTIGLVGKPSAGKSTFFNAATAFSRQRGQQEGDGNASEWGGASMAAHPFTTIDPNIGYCYVPAPQGSCPEDDLSPEEARQYGSTHGRDPSGRRYLPVLLKDVAGLVPGAYQGKGRGNQFLNDLTDATVLIHVADASGSADSSGNKIVNDDDGTNASSQIDPQYSNPIDDLAWIRRELVEWVYSNLMAKWDVVARKGRSKLAGMFSGYGQRESMVEAIFDALEKYLERKYHRDGALDSISTWNECDVHRVVSLFLGVRFPMAICLNKYDLPSARQFVDEILESLPIHGAHAGVPLSARAEMNFVREQMSQSKIQGDVSPPFGVWRCLTTAVMLKEPVLVFPVSDFSTLAPMPGLNRQAIEDPSLPSTGMIRCIEAAGGSAPTCWNHTESSYLLPSKTHRAEGTGANTRLRDALMMKPGSTVEDVFFTLKRLGALSGEFVRAEASSGSEGEKPKPVPKMEIVTRKIRVIKIMSNKRTAWQTS